MLSWVNMCLCHLCTMLGRRSRHRCGRVGRRCVLLLVHMSLWALTALMPTVRHAPC